MSNNKELFMKWIQNLFYVQCVALAATLIAKLPFIGSWFGWVIRIISIVTILVIFKLSFANVRYRKSSILMGISVVLGFLLSKDFAIFALVGAICSIIGTYQEYTGHSEVVADIDEKLSKNWHTLFNWNFWGGLAVSFAAAIIAVAIGVASSGKVDFAVGVTGAILDGYNIIMKLVYLVLLKRMLTVYTSYEPQVEIPEKE